MNIRDARKFLNLSEDDFNAVAGHLHATLEELNVQKSLIEQVMTIAASTHDDVLNIGVSRETACKRPMQTHEKSPGM